MIRTLIKVAEQLDKKGCLKEADTLDKIIAEASEATVGDLIEAITTREQLDAQKGKLKEEVMGEIKYQMEMIQQYLGSIENSIEMARPVDRTGDLDWHLTRLKEAFESLRALEEKEKEIENKEEDELI